MVPLVDKKTVQTTFRLPSALHRALKVRLAEQGKSLSAWAKEVAEAYLEKK